MTPRGGHCPRLSSEPDMEVTLHRGLAAVRSPRARVPKAVRGLAAVSSPDCCKPPKFSNTLHPRSCTDFCGPSPH